MANSEKSGGKEQAGNQASREELLRDLGAAAASNQEIEYIATLSELKREDLPKIAPRGAGESAAAYEVRMKNLSDQIRNFDGTKKGYDQIAQTINGSTASVEPESSADKEVRDFAANSRERYGKTFSEEDIEQLLETAKSDPEAFKRIMEAHNAHLEKSQLDAEVTGFKNAQAEIARTLEGHTPEEYLQKADADMRRLAAEIKQIEETDYSLGEMARLRDKRLAEARQDFASMARHFRMVQQLQMGDKAVAMDPRLFDDLTPEELFKANTEELASFLDPLEPDYVTKKNMRRAGLDNIRALLSAAEYNELLRRIDSLESTEAKRLEFSQVNQNAGAAPSPDEFADERNHNGKNGGNSNTGGDDGQKPEPKPKSGDQPVPNGGANSDPATARSDMEAKQDLLRGLTKGWSKQELARDRFDQYDEELQRMNREQDHNGRAERLARRARGRVPLINWRNKFMRSAVKGLLGTMLAGSLFMAKSLDATEVQAAPANTNELDATANTGSTAEVENSIAEDLGLTPEDFENAAESDLVLDDALAEGAQYYEGFATRDNSEILPNGLHQNFSQYYTANKISKNAFGERRDYIYYIEDAAEQRTETIDALMSISRDQPQVLASVVASCPKLLEAAGLSADVVSIHDVDARAQAVLEAMRGENGGEIQQKLLGALGLALKNENTQFDFYQEYGLENTYYMYRDAQGEMQLGLSEKQRNGDEQVQITITYADGTVEYMDLNLRCGLQTNLNKIKEVRVEITNSDGETTIIHIPGSEDNDETNDSEEKPEEGDPENEKSEDEKPGEETPTEEVQAKNAKNEKRIVEQGGQSQIVDNNSELLEGTERHEDSTFNVDEVRDNMVGTDTQLAEQFEADDSEEMRELTDEEFAALVNKELEEAERKRQEREAAEEAARQAAAQKAAEEAARLAAEEEAARLAAEEEAARRAAEEEAARLAAQQAAAQRGLAGIVDNNAQLGQGTERPTF